MQRKRQILGLTLPLLVTKGTADAAAGDVSPTPAAGDFGGSLTGSRQSEASWETRLVRKPCEHIRGAYSGSVPLNEKSVQLLWKRLFLLRCC